MDGGGLAIAPAGGWFAVWRRERSVFASTPAVPEKRLATEAVQPVVAYAGSVPVILWEAEGGLNFQRGADAPARFAEGGNAACIVSGPNAVTVAWEATADGVKTILFDQVR